MHRTFGQIVNCSIAAEKKKSTSTFKTKTLAFLTKQRDAKNITKQFHKSKKQHRKVKCDQRHCSKHQKKHIA